MEKTKRARKFIEIMSELKIKQNTQTFAALTANYPNYHADTLAVDKIIIENRRCRYCRAKLVYHGISNALEYHALGECPKCGAGERFWTEKHVLRVPEKRKSEAAESRQF